MRPSFADELAIVELLTDFIRKGLRVRNGGFEPVQCIGQGISRRVLLTVQAGENAAVENRGLQHGVVPHRAQLQLDCARRGGFAARERHGVGRVVGGQGNGVGGRVAGAAAYAENRRFRPRLQYFAAVEGNSAGFMLARSAKNA